MSQIIKQPNGKYFLFSSVVDNVIAYDMNRQEIIDYMVEEKRKEIEYNVDKVLKKLDQPDGKPYHQFTQTFDEVIEQIKEVHGEDEAEEVKRYINECD